ncbi:hypothetical protein JXA47_17070 [Candidatus Sumerlaeota bacterium]|nr:hypothetical protein [Candidatus Sumerlaeota bacterium]
MHRLLGIFSLITWKLSRYRGNGIPAWAWFIVGAAFLAGFSVLGLLTALKGQEPTPTEISTIVAGEEEAIYVTLTGFPLYAMNYEEWEGDEGNVTRWFYHLQDPKTGELLLVETRENPMVLTPQTVTLTGMLSATHPQLRDMLQDDMASGPGYRVAVDQFLRPNARPAPIWLPTLGIVVPVAFILLIIAGRRNMFTTFQATPLAPGAAQVPPPTPDAPHLVRATGKFETPGGTQFAREFIGALTPGEDEAGNPCGHLVICKVQEDKGETYWQISIPPGSRTKTGLIHSGMNTMPGLEVTGPGMRAFLGFETPDHALAAQRAIGEA